MDVLDLADEITARGRQPLTDLADAARAAARPTAPVADRGPVAAAATVDPASLTVAGVDALPGAAS